MTRLRWLIVTIKENERIDYEISRDSKRGFFYIDNVLDTATCDFFMWTFSWETNLSLNKTIGF